MDLTEGLSVWVEIHVDDEILSRDPSRFDEARALVMAIAQVAEAQGARLSFRFRTPFARCAAGTDTLSNLVSRGHEVGAHAHGKGLAEAIVAIKAAGLSPTVATPGLVQAGPAGRASLLRQAASHGIELVTDHGPERAWAYDGLMPRVESGVVVAGPTVRPFDWGLMDTDGTRHSLDAAVIDQLAHRERQAQQQGAAYFGVALHEHDLAKPDSLSPDPEPLGLLGQYLSERVQVSSAIDRPAAPQRGIPSRPISDRRVRFARAIHMATARGKRVLEKRGGRLREVPLDSAFELDVDDRRITVIRHGPPVPRAVVMVSHSGRTGGCSAELGPFGLGLRDVVGREIAVYLFDRAGTGQSPAEGPLTPGNRAHMRDWQAVLALAREEGVQVIALSFSAGGIPVLASALRGDRPDAWIDAEGPADRWSLLPPQGNELSSIDPWRDSAWALKEPVRMVPRLGCPYVRLQGTIDHIHGPLTEHARRMVGAAQAAGLQVPPLQLLDGHLHAHPAAVLAAIEWAIEAGGPAG
jgi:hypothetical protein